MFLLPHSMIVWKNCQSFDFTLFLNVGSSDFWNFTLCSCLLLSLFFEWYFVLFRNPFHESVCDGRMFNFWFWLPWEFINCIESVLVGFSFLVEDEFFQLLALCLIYVLMDLFIGESCPSFNHIILPGYFSIILSAIYISFFHVNLLLTWCWYYPSHCWSTVYFEICIVSKLLDKVDVGLTLFMWLDLLFINLYDDV